MTDRSSQHTTEPQRLSPEYAIWKDGEVVPAQAATVSVFDHGFLYGDGVFEGIRIRERLLYRPSDHLDRLQRSCAMLGIEPPYGRQVILGAIAAVADANRLSDAHVRIIVTRGVGAPGIDPKRSPIASMFVLAYPMPPLLGFLPIRLLTSNVVRKAPRSVSPAAKTMNYLDGILAKMQANAAAMDDAIMLDGEGHVAEATGANVFMASGGRLSTPTCVAALPGITRRTVIELATTQGIVVDETILTIGDLHAADEVFLTGTAAGIVPVREVDGRPMAEAPGPLAGRLSEAYAATWTDPDRTVSIDALRRR